MLPNNIVWTYEEGEISLIKDYDKLLITMIYLDTHINNIGQCCFTLDDLIVKSGFITRTGKNNSVEQFKNTLIYLQNLGWLDSALDINNLKPKEFVCCTYQTTFKHDDSDNDTCYFKLYYDNFKKIMDNDFKLDKLITLKIYCYILARMKRNSTEQKEQREDMQYWDGSVIECFYDSYKVICKDLDTTDTTFNLHINLLKELELIYFDNIGLVKNEYGTHIANNVYCETEDWLKQGLKASTEYYIEKGYNLIGKKCSKQTTQKKGLKGQITKQNNEGKYTKELEKKLEKLEEITDNVKVVKVKRKGIGKQLEYRKNIESVQDEHWGESNPFEDIFASDTYKIEVPKKYDYEEHRNKEYEDFIDSLL
jgi:hypothetical protein